MINFYLDLETTVNGGPKADSPEAHWHVNKVLLAGWAVNGSPPTTSDYLPDLAVELVSTAESTAETIRIIGHNLKFDLKYLLRECPHVPWHEFEYHDTMTYEYLASGHKDKFMGLEDALFKRSVQGGKTLDLGAILATGVKMEDIDKDDLTIYLTQDVDLLRKLHVAQSTDMYPTDMDYLLPLAEMELNGLLVDVPAAEALMTQLIVDEGVDNSYLETYCSNNLWWDDGTPLDPTDFDKKLSVKAPRTISYLLTGEPSTGLGPTAGKKRIVFNTGSVRLMDTTDIASIWGNKEPTNLGYPLPADTLEMIDNLYGFTLIGHLERLRKTTKLMNTYVGPMLESAAIDGSIHPKIHTSSTNTGRTSSANPNGQNLPVPARELCYAEDVLYEIDFSQLEMVAAAAQSQCRDLIGAINRGEDLHFTTGKQVMGWKTPADMTKEQRTLVKNVNFGLLYGGGAAGLSIQTGQPKKLIKSLIDGFYAAYPGVETWQKGFYTEVATNMKHAGMRDGEQVYTSLVEIPTGRRFFFRESASPRWLKRKTGRGFSFKPTETKNYPVQGFAGGDIVLTALCYLNVSIQHFIRMNPQFRCKFRITVHDSIVIDSNIPQKQIEQLMTTVCNDVRIRYNLPTNLMFEVSSGSHWS